MYAHYYGCNAALLYTLIIGVFTCFFFRGTRCKNSAIFCFTTPFHVNKRFKKQENKTKLEIKRAHILISHMEFSVLYSLGMCLSPCNHKLDKNQPFFVRYVLRAEPPHTVVTPPPIPWSVDPIYIRNITTTIPFACKTLINVRKEQDNSRQNRHK